MAARQPPAQADPPADATYEPAPPPASPPAPVPEPAGRDTSYLDELERLGRLRDAGVLSEEEFARMKREIIG